MNDAEQNFHEILAVARDIASRSLLAQYSTIDIEPLKGLIRFLKLTFALIRRQRLDADPSIDVQGGDIAAQDTTLGNIEKAPYNCLCPLAVFLRILANSLSEVRVKIGPNAWGSINPLRKKLEAFQSRLVLSRTGNSHPGLSKCIMFHEQNGVFTVTATSPTYKRLSGLELLGKWIRNRQIQDLKGKVSTETREHIERKLQDSEKILAAYNVPLNRRDRPWEQTFTQRTAAHVDGTGATFDSLGRYKVACTVDFCRFSMDRNQIGNAREKNTTIGGRGANGIEACAEWELWLVRLIDGPVQPLPHPKYRIKEAGMAHSNTFPVPKQPRIPAASRHATRMTDVPNLAPLRSGQHPTNAHEKVKKAESWDHTLYPSEAKLLSKESAKKHRTRFWCCC